MYSLTHTYIQLDRSCQNTDESHYLSTPLVVTAEYDRYKMTYESGYKLWLKASKVKPFNLTPRTHLARRAAASSSSSSSFSPNYAQIEEWCYVSCFESIVSFQFPCSWFYMTVKRYVSVILLGSEVLPALPHGVQYFRIISEEARRRSMNIDII